MECQFNSSEKKPTKCFVCNKPINEELISYNKKTNLAVCSKCKGTKEEILAEKNALDSLSEDFVCGCI